MLVMLTGATGFVGSHTAAALAADGHRLRLLVRSPDRVAAALQPLGLDPGSVDVAVGDVTDAAAVRAAVQGADAVVHAASVYSFDTRDHAAMRAVNAAGTETVLTAARDAGAGRIVHVSTVGALLPAAGPLGPDTPPGTARQTYLASKSAAERIARRHQAEGAPVVITYPSSLLGPHDPYVGDGVLRLRNALRGLMPMWPAGGLQLGDVREVAALHAAAVSGAVVPNRLFDTGTYVTTREYVRTIEQVTGRRLPALYLPAKAMMPVGLLVSSVQRFVPVHLPAEYGALYVVDARARVAEGHRASLGVPPRPLASTVADTVRWLAETGELTPRQAGAAAQASTAGVPARPGGAA